MSVSVNPPKTPVTKGSSGLAAATVPNVCKMPGPPAPFVPTPLPNIGKSGDSPRGYSKKVKIKGQPVAIKGATFKSIGDIASKGTGGGLISAQTHGKTNFVAPGSLDVKIEGKNVHLLTDMTLNNCGSPANAATSPGVVQAPGTPAAPPSDSELDCGEVGTYGDQKKRTAKGKYHRDHIPSKAALKARAKELNGNAPLSRAQENSIEKLAVSVVIPASAHRRVSPTYGGRNAKLIISDSEDLQAAAKRDTVAMKKELDKHADADCVDSYDEAAQKIEKTTNEDYDKFLVDILKKV